MEPWLIQTTLWLLMGSWSLLTLGQRSYSLGFRLATRDYRADLWGLLFWGCWLPVTIFNLDGSTPWSKIGIAIAFLLPALLTLKCLSWSWRQPQGEILLNLGLPPTAKWRVRLGCLLIGYGLLNLLGVGQGPIIQVYLKVSLGICLGLYLVLSGSLERVITTTGIYDFTGPIFWHDLEDFGWSETLKTWQWWWLPSGNFQCLMLKLISLDHLFIVIGIYLPQSDQDQVEHILQQSLEIPIRPPSEAMPSLHSNHLLPDSN